MNVFLGLIVLACSMGIVYFIIRGIISAIRKTGNFKKNLIYSGVCFIGIIIFAIIGSSLDKSTKNTALEGPASTAAITETKPPKTPKPTPIQTLKPTQTPKPTQSPKPTPTLAATPTPTPVLTEEEKANIAKEKERVAIAAADKAKADKKEADAVARKKLIESQFSLWDGSHKGLKDVIKAAMNDPDSFKHDETTYRDDGDYITVQTKYRGKNAFGGVVRGVVVAKVTLDGQVFEIVSEK